jgi:hypothetical protein
MELYIDRSVHELKFLETSLKALYQSAISDVDTIKGQKPRFRLKPEPADKNIKAPKKLIKKLE